MSTVSNTYTLHTADAAANGHFDSHQQSRPEQGEPRFLTNTLLATAAVTITGGSGGTGSTNQTRLDAESVKVER